MDEIEKNNQIVAQPATQSLIQDLRQIIEQARGYVSSLHFSVSFQDWQSASRSRYCKKIAKNRGRF